MTKSNVIKDIFLSRSLKTFEFEKKACQHHDKSFLQELENLTKKKNIFDMNIYWVTRGKSLVNTLSDSNL